MVFQNSLEFTLKKYKYLITSLQLISTDNFKVGLILANNSDLLFILFIKSF